MLDQYLEQAQGIHRAGLIPYNIKKDKVYVAIMKPSDPKYGGTDFQFCKGKVEDGDDFITTAQKECKQELGLHVEKNTIKLLWNNKNKNMQWFFCEVPAMYTLTPGPNENGVIETMECQWMEINKAHDILRDWQKPIVQMLKRRLGI